MFIYICVCVYHSLSSLPPKKRCSITNACGMYEETCYHAYNVPATQHARTVDGVQYAMEGRANKNSTHSIGAGEGCKVGDQMAATPCDAWAWARVSSCDRRVNELSAMPASGECRLSTNVLYAAYMYIRMKCYILYCIRVQRTLCGIWCLLDDLCLHLCPFHQAHTRQTNYLLFCRWFFLIIYYSKMY